MCFWFGFWLCGIKLIHSPGKRPHSVSFRGTPRPEEESLSAPAHPERFLAPLGMTELPHFFRKL